jgi:hypothetical protein
LREIRTIREKGSSAADGGLSDYPTSSCLGSAAISWMRKFDTLGSPNYKNRICDGSPNPSSATRVQALKTGNNESKSFKRHSMRLRATEFFKFYSGGQQKVLILLLL